MGHVIPEHPANGKKQMEIVAKAVNALAEGTPNNSLLGDGGTQEPD
jgi:hypothetical protein